MINALTYVTVSVLKASDNIRFYESISHKLQFDIYFMPLEVNVYDIEKVTGIHFTFYINQKLVKKQKCNSPPMLKNIYKNIFLLTNMLEEQRKKYQYVQLHLFIDSNEVSE